MEGSLIPYLPQDDAVAAGLGAHEGGIDAMETQQVADLLNEELGKLLKMQPLEFWKTVTMDHTIEVSLDSYLQYRRRWYDLHVNEKGKPLAGVIVGDQELHRRVFMVLYRMSSNLEHGSSSTSDDLSPEKHAEIAYKRQLFDIPKLLDICAIYGHDNAVLTQRLVSNAFATNQRLHDDLADIVAVLSKTIHTMLKRCFSTLTMQIPTSNSGTSVVSKLQQELLEVLDYLHDAVISLHAFMGAYPEGGIILVLAGSQSVKDQILPTLVAMHDALIPTVHKSFSRLRESDTENHMESIAETRSRRLRFRVIELVWRLLCLSYLSENNPADSQNGTVNGLEKAGLCDPGARGEALVQVLSGMVEEPSEFSPKEELMSNGVLLRNIERKHRLLNRVNQLLKKGLIALDSAQYDYVEAIIGYTTPAISSSMPNHSVFPPISQQMPEVDVLYESKISHIKDILPDYGNGFIAACLEAYDNNPEEVLQRILEGTLHPSLQSLDTTLEAKPGVLTATVSVKDKGKGKFDEAPSWKKESLNDLTEREHGNASGSARWHDDADGLVQRLSSSTSAGSSSVNEDGSRISSKRSNVESPKNLGGRFVRKQKGEENVAAVLNDRDAEDALRTAAYAAQYEDEYDDSFDDLGAHIADGVEETEILVDLARSKSLLGAAVDSERSNKMSTGGKSDGLSKGTWPVNNGGTHETRATSARETSSRSTDTQRKAQLQPARGRGRGRRDEPRGQYFVKDGKSYSYKVTGSVGVSSAEEAEALNRVEEETIHGLRQGGNMPVFKQQAADGKNSIGTDTHTNSRSIHGDLSGRGGAAHNRGRGGPRKEYDNHHRKDRAMKKHFAGIGGL